MRYEDNSHLNNGEDNEFWDDELELNAEGSSSEKSYDESQGYTSAQTYDSYSSQEYMNYTDEDQPEEASETYEDSESEDYYSDSDAQEPTDQKREGFFRKKANKVEEEENDYFDSDDEPAPVKKIKTPKLDPEDPDYWIEEDESPLTGIIQQTSNRWKWWLGGALTLIVLILFCWIWFLRPYTDNAVKYGYISNMERRGTLIKTFEGTMIPYKELGDPDPLYFHQVNFSVESDSLAAVMKRMMIGCVPVRVEYKLYHSSLPWKGDEKMIVIKADTADPRKILPPEYRK